MDEEPDVALYALATAHTPGLAQVGGKGASLIEMTRAGLPVPSGFVLTTGFFRPWLERLRATVEWDAFVAAVTAEETADEELRTRAADLATVCEGLSFDESQQRHLAEVLEQLAGSGRTSGSSSGSFAVRSSAPQEDLGAASFAGVYDTVLGVPPGELADAARTVFTSSLDFKAVSYKRQRGFDPTDVQIAVVVQQQLDSASAGVAFSLNPQNNDYDEAVIQANWGLGETVVSGSVTPDQFVVDKVAGRVVDTRLGAKETVLWSQPEGGSVEKRQERSAGKGPALTDEQAVAIVRMVQRVEPLVAAPVDIEWAYASDGSLYLLQARPVTTYFPLPDELRTAPGEPRRLYMDGTLLEEGLQQPLSVLGERWMEDAIVAMVRQITRRRIPTRSSDGLVSTVGGRWYANVSNLLWLGTERLARSLETLDVHAAQVLRNVDAQRYREAATKPTVTDVVQTVVGTVSGSAGPVGRTLVALASPERARRRYETVVDQHRQHLVEMARTARSVPQLGEEALQPTVRLLMREGLPLTCAAETASSLIRVLYRGAGHQLRQCLDAALRSMPHNVTIEMGLALYDLARTVEKSAGREAYADLPALARRIEARELPEPLLQQWDAFMDSYGFRGPDELDLASSRYADDATLVLEQMRQYVLLDESTQESPQDAYERRQRQRCEAYRELLDQTRSSLTKRLVKRLYRTAETFSGYREIHKYQLVRAGNLVRQRALELGRELVEHQRLDFAEQVFDLTCADLPVDSDGDDAGPDLRARARSNTGYRRRIRKMPGSRFPVVVDSRGRIPGPASSVDRPGVLTGEGVSAGAASGPAKVLRHVGEKPVLPGDVLVARATDPGWTPLFVHAAGIVLETGGSFQHGALVAREYGKPCLVGIADATERICDGQLVELNGTAGTLTLVADDATSVDLSRSPRLSARRSGRH